MGRCVKRWLKKQIGISAKTKLCGEVERTPLEQFVKEMNSFLWQSGAGWFARCIVTTDARVPTRSDPAPWDDGREYKWIFGIKVIKELDPIYQPGSTNNRQNITGIHNIRLGQFPRLSHEETTAVRSFFGLINPPSEPSDIEIENQNDQHEAEI